MIPRATYRVQFHRGFTFANGARLAPYLARLGVSHLYSSPIQTARSGSRHGYDIVDHATINPELGGSDGFFDMARALKAHGIGIILDIVPNHMFVGGDSNRWWQDVLEHGSRSPFASHFDIDWNPTDPGLRGKVLLPFLGQSYSETLGSGVLKLIFDEAYGKLAFSYHDHRFPLRHEDYAEVLRGASPEAADLTSYIGAALDALLERQNYVLAWWQSAGDRINWRRFFDVNELAGLRIEREEVFEAVHALPLELYARGLVDGFRIDHVDGLANPAGYCRRLRARLAELQNGRPHDAASGPAYLVVEKVLASGEPLPTDWKVDGTTGYDFMAEVSALQHHPYGEAPLIKLWQRFSGRSGNFDREQRVARSQILDAFEAQVMATATAFAKVAEASTQYRDLSALTLRRAIRGLIADLDTYRTSLTGRATALLPRHLEHAATSAKPHETPVERAATDFIVVALAGYSSPDSSAVTDAARRFNQLASAVAAKGVEDTAFYRHAVLLSRNDVGSDPRIFSTPPSAFHSSCTRRGDFSPHTLIATATHDHKRGEDARARLAILSELPSRWENAVEEWLASTASARTGLVEIAECYHLFQTLVGAWPCDFTVENQVRLEEFRERILVWRMKALREAKLKTSWTMIDPAYEAAHADFVATILDPHRSRDFLASFQHFVHEIAPAGAANALSQTVLRLTVPGVPDTYQGTEFWDFTLVDPDNRRDVDFSSRRGALEEDADISPLALSWRDGRIKQAVIAGLLGHRAADPDLFEKGRYFPLETRGIHAQNLVAFARAYEKRHLLISVACHCAEALCGQERIAPSSTWWGDTTVLLPSDTGSSLRSLFGTHKADRLSGGLLVSELLTELPFFALVAS